MIAVIATEVLYSLCWCPTVPVLRDQNGNAAPWSAAAEVVNCVRPQSRGLASQWQGNLSQETQWFFLNPPRLVDVRLAMVESEG